MKQARYGHVREMARQIVKEHGFKQPPVLPEAIAKAERLEVLKVMTWPDALSGLLLRESFRVYGMCRTD